MNIAINHALLSSTIFGLVLSCIACVPPTPPPVRLPPAEPRRQAAPAAGTHTAARDEIARPVSEAYTGDLAIFEDPERDRKLQIDRVMDILRVGAGASVADIGAGSGWFTVRAARRVGASGQVYAVEINPEYIEYIERRAGKEGLQNVRTVLGRPDDPLLPRQSVDAVLILKTYHEIEAPVVLLRRVHESLKPGGRLGIIDRDGTGGDHGIRRDDVVREAARAGFRLVEEHDFVKPDNEDYYLVFESAN